MRIGMVLEISAHPYGIATTIGMADRPKRAGPPADGGKEGTGTAVVTLRVYEPRS